MGAKNCDPRMAIVTPRKMAIPPNRGVGVVCTFLASGASMIPNRLARKIDVAAKKTLISNAIKIGLTT